MRILIKNAEVFDAGLSYEKRDILIEGETILDVSGGIGAEPGTDVIDLSGYTVLPCFVDAHVHVAASESHGPSERRGYSDDMLRAYAFNGVSLVKDLGMLENGPLEPYMEWLRGQDTREHARVVTAGRYIDVEGGYGMGPAFGGQAPGWGIRITTAEEAADAVTYEYECGVNGIKIGISDGGMGPKLGELSHDMIRAITRRAAEHGIWTTAHVGKSEDLWKLVECGIGEAAHTPTDRMSDDLIGVMVGRGVKLTTTIGQASPPGPGGPGGPEVRPVVIDNFRRFYRAGGSIAIGTDFMHSGDFMRDAKIPVGELAALREAGLPMQEIVRCGTVNAARSCGVGDEGRVEAGCRANLIAIPGRLDEGFTKLEHPPFVMNRGKILRGRK